MTLPPLSLRGKLFVFTALLILVPGLLLGVLADRSARDSLQTVIGRQLAREALHTADGLTAFLSAERQSLASFARQDLMRELRVGDIDKRVAQALTTLLQGGAARLAYVALDPDGRVVAASDAEWFGDAARRGLSTLPRDGRDLAGPLQLQGHRVLALGTPVPDPDGGDDLGRLVGLLEWHGIEARLEAVRRELDSQGIDATLLLVEGDRTLARSGWAEPRLAALPSRPGFAIDPDDGWIAGAARLDGEPYGWTLLVVEPLDHALAPARALTRRLSVTTAVALAGALLLATLSARRVAHPLSELTEAIRGMGAGRLGATAVPVRSDDEVGTLARSFNQMAAELDEAQKHLVEAEKFAFVGELASGVAHEVRTSLGVLRSSAQLLERSLGKTPDPSVPELVGMIRDEVGRLGGVVDDLLTLDRPRASHPEPTPLSLPLLRAAEFVEPRARERRVEIRIETATPEPIVCCDREAIQHACVNLLVNALQAVDVGGRVEGSVQPGRDGFASVRVEDDGPGLDDGLSERIFDPFVTGRDAGVGLGLTFVKRAAHEHGGRIRVGASELGGCCFELQLPLAEPGSEPAP